MALSASEKVRRHRERVRRRMRIYRIALDDITIERLADSGLLRDHELFDHDRIGEVVGEIVKNAIDSKKMLTG